MRRPKKRQREPIREPTTQGEGEAGEEGGVEAGGASARPSRPLPGTERGISQSSSRVRMRQMEDRFMLDWLRRRWRLRI